MVRIGKNPLKEKKVHSARPYVSCCTITCVPELSGYWSEMKDVVEFSILSMKKNTKIDNEIILLDNGSCKDFVNFLISVKDYGLIDRLVLCNDNMGKIGGINILSSIFSSNYFMYADSDIYFMPGWLERHVEIFETFHRHGLRPGMITGTPLPVGDIDKMLAFLSKAEGVEVREHVLPESYLKMHAEDIGKSIDRIAKSLRKVGYIASIDGVEAFLGAWHMQFLMSREVASRVFPLSANYALRGDEDRQIEETVEKLGYLRLSPPNYVLRHIGNVICGDLRSEYNKLKISNQEIGNVSNRVSADQSYIYKLYLSVKRIYNKIKMN